jgi:hypothetical protein
VIVIAILAAFLAIAPAACSQGGGGSPNSSAAPSY